MKTTFFPTPGYIPLPLRPFPKLLFDSAVDELPSVLQANWRPGGFTATEAALFGAVALYRILTAPIDYGEKLALMKRLRMASPTAFKVPPIHGFIFTPFCMASGERVFAAWETEDHVLVRVRESMFLRLSDLARYNVAGDIEVLLRSLDVAKVGVHWLEQVYLPGSN
ncbi:hypothetical protein PSQ39_11790 [Curvibacter sp. HBC28]|uniref:Uncharacterized protein n=1 Tax=Curvibacter microcysteis TaxID=3026419 RepID=A0ABT5MH56_9BURK|nr:hypothetical protein [Curvibacter sp. HBC28]MDD0815314.1 hypothetical protein [Curvibacter sp. HBC28]